GELLGERRRDRRLRKLTVVVAALGDRVERRVVYDAMQPPAQLGDLNAREQCGPCAEHCLLHDVVSAIRAHDATRVRAQLTPVTLEDRAEGQGVAGARKRTQALVGL